MVQATSSVNQPKQKDLPPVKTDSPIKKPEADSGNSFFDKAANMTKTADGKPVNLFTRDDLNKDYSEALKSKDPNAKNLFVQELALLDSFGGKNPDNKIDGKIDGQNIFNVKDDKQKNNFLDLILQTLGLNKGQDENQQMQSLTANSDIPAGLSVIIPLPALGSSAMRQRDYSPAQIKELNNEGVYTSATEMTPEMRDNITKGKIKNIQAGTFGGVKLSDSQINNAEIIAATIVDAGKGKSPEEIHKAVVIALATAMQESTLKNIGYGDRDSVGLFQQRPSCGWGSKEECKDPVHATRQFAEKLYKTDYMNKSVTKAAQNVQRSGFPDAYAKWQKMAEALATAMGI